MKKMIAMAAGAALLAGATMGIANAQGRGNGPFADVPTDHWAYSSVETLRNAGIVIGYPDGTYGGARPTSRYEFATAIARLLKLIPDANSYATKDDLGKYVQRSDIPNTNGLESKSDVDALRADLLSRLQAHDEAIAALKDLVNQFKPELTSLGVRVDEANAKLDALAKRVSVLEDEVNRVKITGAVNFIVRSDVNTKSDGAQPLDEDGFAIGLDNRKSGFSSSTSIFDNPRVYEDLLLNIVGRVSDTAKAVLSIDGGSYEPWLQDTTGLNSNRQNYGNPSHTGTTASFNIYNAYLTAPVNGVGFSGVGQVGRFGTQFSALTLKAVNPDSYSTLTQTSSGNVIVDGASTQGTFLGVPIQAFAGVVPTTNGTNGSSDYYGLSANGYLTGTKDGGFRPGSAGGNGGTTFNSYNYIDNLGGLRLGLPTILGFTTNVTGLWGRTTDSSQIDPNNGKTANNFAVLGADISGNLSTVGVTGEIAYDSTGYNSNFGSVNSNHQNLAWNAGLTGGFFGVAIKASYEHIDPYYDAPGAWEQIGSWINPSNVKGVNLEASLPLSDKLTIKASGLSYQGIDNAGTFSPLGKDDKIGQVAGTVGYALSKETQATVGYEWVQWDLKANQGITGLSSGKPEEQYITLGLGHAIAKASAIKFLYQIETYKDKNTGFNGSTNGINNGDTHGGIFETQVSVKF
jgi:hypothetical protein